MDAAPIIRKITLSRYRFPFDDVGRDLSFAMGPFYELGGEGARSVLGIRIETDQGVTGEYMSIAPGVFEQIQQFADMALDEATDFWRADPEYDGGITGVMKVAHSAEGYGMDVELHIAGPAQRHCMAAMRNSNFY